MEQNLLVAIIAGLGGMFGWGFSDFFAKKTVDRVGEYTTLFWAQIIGAVPLIFLLFWEKSVPSLQGFDYIAIIGLGVLDTLSWVYLYKGFEKGKISLLSPIFSSTFALAVFISAIFFGEKISMLHWFALGVVFLGILFASGDIKGLKTISFKKTKGLSDVLLATVQFGFWFALWGHYINGKSWVFYMLLMRLIVALCVYIVCKLKKESLFVRDTGVWKYVILIGIFDVGAYALTSIGFSRTSYISIVAMISGAFPLPTLILARVFLKEEITILQTIGAIIIISGIMFLSFVQ